MKKQDRTKQGPTPKQNKWTDPFFLKRLKRQRQKHIYEPLNDYCKRAGITRPKTKEEQ